MILYFSGTGNSEYAAKRIGKEIGDEVLNLFEKIKSSDVSALHSARPWVVVAPTYAWRIPRILHKWLQSTPLTGNKDLYFVMTCGGSIGNAAAHLEKLCAEKGMRYRGCAGIRMPENYIGAVLHPDRGGGGADPPAGGKIHRQHRAFDPARRQAAPSGYYPRDKANSGIVNDIFYPLFVHAKKFYVTDDCVSCKKCADVCPLGNIKLADGKPVWGDRCTHCMACISRCPKEAIEYGTHSRGLPRYLCPKQA